jgi:hypothetical protein
MLAGTTSIRILIRLGLGLGLWPVGPARFRQGIVGASRSAISRSAIGWFWLVRRIVVEVWLAVRRVLVRRVLVRRVLVRQVLVRQVLAWQVIDVGNWVSARRVTARRCA